MRRQCSGQIVLDASLSDIACHLCGGMKLGATGRLYDQIKKTRLETLTAFQSG